MYTCYRIVTAIGTMTTLTTYINKADAEAVVKRLNEFHGGPYKKIEECTFTEEQMESLRISDNIVY